MPLDVTLQLKHAAWKTALRPYAGTVRGTLAAALAETALAECDCRWSMAVLLADDAFIRGLNRDYRGYDKPTNVLSFAAAPAIEAHARRLSGRGECELGDIVIAYETVAREAAEQGKSFAAHARHLLVHGLLHLLGYDHEEEAQARKMENLEIKILKKQGIDNPYLSR